MWMSLLALTFGAPIPDDATTSFKQMDQTVRKAETFSVEFELNGPGKDDKMKGRLLVARGNKVRLELEGTFLGRPGKMSLVSDGVKSRWTEGSGPGKDQDTRDQMSEMMLAMTSRAGVFTPLLTVGEKVENGKKPAPYDVERDLVVSDFKVGKPETVGGAEVQVVTYKLKMRGASEPLAVTLWIDTKTNLPVKRVVTFMVDKDTVTITETYSKTAVNPKLNDREFALPK